jgi:phosphoribosylanthranilate isomerase
MFVKICGLANAEDVRAVAAMEPDAIGFIFYPKSPRGVLPEQVKTWVAGLPASLIKVGVFVDESAEMVNRTLRQAGLDVAQLHGRETPATCDAVDAVTWKAVNLRDFPDPDALKPYHVDAFLIDGYTETMPGGTGTKVDWERAAVYGHKLQSPMLLAGGLRADNVADAIRRVTPWGVDVSSGVEIDPGRKDLHKVRQFITIARGS